MKYAVTWGIILFILSACDLKSDVGEVRNGQFRKLGEPTFEERDVAIKAGAESLHLMDDNRIGDIWPFVGNNFRNQTSQSELEKIVSSIRFKVGRYRKRNLVGATFANEIDGAPAGQYYLIDYESEFENGTIQERIVMNLEEGKWKIEGFWGSKNYIVKKKASGNVQ